MSARLAFDNVACLRGDRLLFEGLSFALGPGEAALVTGPNGAGKSSLLRLIAGLVPKTSGRLVLEGGDEDRPFAEQVHYAGHADALKPSLTARETLAFWRSVYGEPRLMPDEALEELGIGHLADLPAAYFSAGQKRRLALARLFVSSRPIWLLDEPTSALDSDGEARLTAAIAEHRSRGGLVVLATHQPVDVPEAATLRLDDFTGANDDALASLD